MKFQGYPARSHLEREHRGAQQPVVQPQLPGMHLGR